MYAAFLLLHNAAGFYARKSLKTGGFQLFGEIRKPLCGAIPRGGVRFYGECGFYAVEIGKRYTV